MLDEAIRDYDRRRFFARADAAYRRLKKDREAWCEELAEREQWDSTLADDLSEEYGTATGQSRRRERQVA